MRHTRGDGSSRRAQYAGRKNVASLQADSPVQYVKGVGPARAEALAGLGIRTVGDLLEYYPFRHEPEADETDIEDLKLGEPATIRGEIIRMRGDGHHRPLDAVVHDGTDVCTLRWFQAPWLPDSLAVGKMIVATGKVEEFGGGAMMVHPGVQVFAPGAPIFSRGKRGGGRRLLGVYRGSGEIKTTTIRKAVLTVLDQPALPVEEILPPALVKQHGLMTRQEAVRRMHVPRGEQELEAARRRLAYEEFLLMELAIALRRRKTVTLEKATPLRMTPEIDARIRARFPFTLTASQNSVIREIARDLQRDRPMTRLLQGDVGCGKTVVALYASLAAIANKRQAAIMAPTEILAEQHYNKIAQYLAGSRVRFALLRGGQRKAERESLLAAIESGEMDLVVGTQALLEKKVAFADLAMVTVDEQHKFGVVQRATFRTKGPAPHYLVMTATPIPRTLSMTVFGDLDVSIIKHSPPGRGKVITRVVPHRKLPDVLAYVRKRLEGGEQAYVVCPLIGERSDQLGEHQSPDDAGEHRRPAGASGAEGSGIGDRGSGIGDRESGIGDRESGIGDRGSGKPSEREAQASAAPGGARPASNRSERAAQASAAPRGVHSSRTPVSPQSKIQNPKSKTPAIQNPKSKIPPRAALASATETWHALRDGPWRGLAVELLHGGMSSDDKQRIMADFAAGRVHALVATTVVEVGVDVPNATIMLVEHAERFGLSQLHQLRGRIGRGGKNGLCVLIAHGRGGKSAERLDVMARTTDGFRIAEADLKQRGPGELLGTRQHGLPELRVGSIIDGFALLETARQDAFAIVAADPQLRRPEHARMVPALKRLFGDKLALIDAA